MDIISDQDHRIVCDWIRTHIGVDLDDGKKYLIETRLEPVAFKYGFESIHELLQLLGSGRHIESALQSDIFSSITTHETSFFRDHHPFEFLRTHYIPSFIQRTDDHEELRVWSSACSSGQEIYSLVMLVLESFKREIFSRLHLHATDICHRTLDKARSGVYSQSEISRGLHAMLLVKYFEEDTHRNWVIKKDVRESVHFEHHNLIDSWEHIERYDIIFLRNVLIYFDVDLKRTILNRLKEHLNPGGVLFLGGSESTANLDSDWKINSENGCVYYSLK